MYSGNVPYKIQNINVLTSVSGPLSAPGQEKVTNSWHLLWTTKQQTGEKRERAVRIAQDW